MSDVVHLKFGTEPAVDRYLLITRQGRIRGEDFYIQPSPPLASSVVGMHAAFASLDSALNEAQNVARRHGVGTIYVRMS